MRLHEYCEYPAVRYKILFHLLDTPYENDELTQLRHDSSWVFLVDDPETITGKFRVQQNTPLVRYF